MYFTYVLLSEKDGKRYIGWTNNIKERITKHSQGKVVATKNRRFLKLVYLEGCLRKSKAVKREKYFKTGFGRRFLDGRI